MDYKTAWEDTVSWLDRSIKHLEDWIREQRLTEYSVGKKEYERVKNKLEGLKVVRQHMVESEKIYDTK